MISRIIFTKNEEVNLLTCLASLEKLDEDIFIVNFCSTDLTIEIANKIRYQIFENTFKNHTLQVNWTLEYLHIKIWIDKHNSYANREIKDILTMRSLATDSLVAKGQLSQANQRR